MSTKALDNNSDPIRPTNLQCWFMAIRPKTLPASLSPVILGSALAYQQQVFQLSTSILIGLCALLMQIGTNLVNDYYDSIRGVDHPDRIGPTRVTQAKLIIPGQVRIGYLIAFLLAFLIGIKLTLIGGTEIFYVGVLCLFIAYAYTGGPVPLSHYGLGELLAFFFFGPIAVIGTYYIQAQTVPPEVLLLSFGPGLLSAALMATNNLRDRKNDLKSKKWTLAVLLGELAGRLILFTCLVLSCMVPVIYFYFYHPHAFTLFPSLLIVPMRRMWKKILIDPIDERLNIILGSIGKFMFIYSLTLSIGIILTKN